MVQRPTVILNTWFVSLMLCVIIAMWHLESNVHTHSLTMSEHMPVALPR